MHTKELFHCLPPSKHVGELQWPTVFDPQFRVKLVKKLGTNVQQTNDTQKKPLPSLGELW